VQNINTVTGIGQNTGGAQALLLDLTGSLGNAFQVQNSPGGLNPVYVPGETRYRNWSQHEVSWFVKDEYKITPNLTLNFGLRYEWYAVPHERQGKALALVGGGGGLFGISGTSFSDLFQPGRFNGSLSRVQLVGRGTSNPDIRLFREDKNNFAPSAGIVWSLPWFGKNKTVVRTGYGIGYERNPIYLTHTVSGLQPGLSETTVLLVPSLFNLSNLRLPVPPSSAPLAPIPLTARTQTLYGFDEGLRNPYIQNFNLSITRSLRGGAMLEVRYVGSKATKLVRETNVNEISTVENGILEAYRITRAGGHAPLLDRIFMGLGGVNGSTFTGSDLARTNASIQGFFANTDVGGFANFLSGSNLFTGVNGGLLRRAGLPENFVLANPQVAIANFTSNFSGSTYHSMQAELTRRFISGWTFQGNYTWSRTLGDYDGEDAALISSFRTLRNRNLDKKPLSYHRQHVWRSNGIWELPFGPGKPIGRNTSGIAGHLLRGWQTGAIFSLFSGEAISFGAANGFNTAGGATPMVLGPQPSGSVERTGNGVVYFTGVRQATDPQVGRITALGGIQARSTLRAIADSSGRILLANPEPGQFGTLAQRSLYGPGSFRFDLNLIRRLQVTERIELHLRA
ncbi:MAG: TonB-dependent receptor domain-containing protein, partial [Bryobacteraceae bacterium]